MENRAILRAWEAFHQGSATPEQVRPAVLASWQRSRKHAIAIGCAAAAMISEAELHRRRQQNQRFLHAARPALEEARHFLAGANSMAILSDLTGTVLETEGDARAVDYGHRVRLQKGGLWAEAEIGTNAIGTALAIGAPVQIHAAEHFCSEVQKWTCAAAPVRHPLDGDVLGAIDISGPADTFNRQSLAHAVAMAHQIEAFMGRRIEAEHDRVLHHFLGKRSLWLTEELVAFGRGGALIYSTDKALKEIERRNPALLAEGRLAVLRDIDPDLWPARLAAALPGASVERVRWDGEDLGGILVLHEPRRARAPSRPAAREEVETTLAFEAILGDSPAMRDACAKARRMAQSGAAILLEGETGVGKELFARAIHGAHGTGGPFIPVNCGGLPRDLIASEIFGYEKGAFTGADSAGRSGKVEAANGGLLCLDEIGEMPLELQSYLLRVLEDRVVYRVGAHAGRRVDIRLVSMTNRDLSGEVAAGRFRKDLYYRIAALRLRIPPLRERGEDALLLLDHYMSAAARRAGRPAPRFSTEAQTVLAAYGWPGNVRELRNVADLLVTLCPAPVIEPPDLPPEMRGHALAPQPAEGVDLRSLEQAAVLQAINACGGNLSRAAKRLGIARSTLYARLAELNGREG